MSGMKRDFRTSILAWLLLGVSAALAADRQVIDRRRAEHLESGQEIFLASCAMCHGDRGNGDGPLAAQLLKEAGVGPAKLNDAARLRTLGRAEVKRIIIQGGGHRHRSNLMPPWGDKLGPKAADDVTDFVMALPGLDPGTPAATVAKYLTTSAGSAGEGQGLFVYYCSGCHGLSGKGDGVYAKAIRARHKVWPRNLTQTGYFAEKTDQDLYVVIALGGGHVGKSPMMPAWSVTMTPQQIKDLVSYVRVLSKTKSQP